MGVRTGKPRGRPKGVTNRITKERQKRVEEAARRLSTAIDGGFTGDGHDLLMAIYKDPAYPIMTRLDAAKAAIPYEKPRLAAIEHTGNDEKPLKTVLEIAWGSSKE